MNEADVLKIAQDGSLTLIMVVAPLLLTGMAVGLCVSVFQTLTSLQEMTLIFVPKILAVFTALVVFFPYMVEKLTTFANAMFDKIVVIG